MQNECGTVILVSPFPNQEGLKVGLGLKKKEKDRQVYVKCTYILCFEKCDKHPCFFYHCFFFRMGRMNPGAVYVSAKAKTLAEKRAKLQVFTELL